MNKLITICAVVAVFVFGATTAWADTHYADPAGNDIHPYTTPETAAHKIQDAIDAATGGDTVDVAAGPYNENITIDKSLIVEGANHGVNATAVERGPESIIDAQLADYGVFIIEATTTATLDGFTVRNYEVVGILAGGFGPPEDDPFVVHILNNVVEAPSPLVDAHNNNIQVGDGTTGTIIGNEVSGALLVDPDWSGSGILVSGSGDVLVSNNYVHGCEGGIQIQGYANVARPPAEDNHVENNLAENCEAGISVQGNSMGTIIRYNDVLNNDEGIVSMAYDLSWWGGELSTPSGTEIRYNNIVGNEYGVKSVIAGSFTGNGLAEEVDATYNWWGGIGGPGGEGLGNGDNVTANVLYDPWLTEDYATTIDDGIAYFGSTIPLEPGWNTLSVPLKLRDSANTIAEIMDLGDFLTSENVEIVYQYNSGFDTIWENIGASDTELVPLLGYYIKILGTDTVDFPVLYSGQLGLPTLKLSNGWNLIGSAFGIDKNDYGIAATTDDVDGQKDVATALYSIKDKCSVVVSPSTQGQVAAWGTTVIDSDKVMIVGEAYWVFMTTPVPTLAGFEVTPIYDLP